MAKKNKNKSFLFRQEDCDWISEPSETIHDIMEEKHLTVEDVVMITGLSQYEIEQILYHSYVPQCLEDCDALAKLGGTAQFWWNRYVNWTNQMERLRAAPMKRIE
jgi:hypothetical protein